MPMPGGAGGLTRAVFCFVSFSLFLVGTQGTFMCKRRRAMPSGRSLPWPPPPAARPTPRLRRPRNATPKASPWRPRSARYLHNHRQRRRQQVAQAIHPRSRHPSERAEQRAAPNRTTPPASTLQRLLSTRASHSPRSPWSPPLPRQQSRRTNHQCPQTRLPPKKPPHPQRQPRKRRRRRWPQDLPSARRTSQHFCRNGRRLRRSRSGACRVDRVSVKWCESRKPSEEDIDSLIAWVFICACKSTHCTKNILNT